MKTFRLLLLSTFILTCQSRPGPEKVLSDFLSATSSGNYNEAYLYISSKDKLVKSFDEYAQVGDSMEYNISKAIGSKMSFEIVSIETLDNTGRSVVDITMPDFEQIFGEVLGLAFTQAFSDDETGSDDMENILKDKYGNGDIPMKTETKHYDLVKEDDGWKIFLNWEVEELIIKAENLKESKQLYEAMDLYTEAIGLDSDNETVLSQLKDVQAEINIYEEKQKYIGQIELYDLQARYINTYLDKRVPAVKFKLKNKGDRTLNKVEVTVFFKDGEGNIIFEKSLNPVLVSEYSFNDNTPLKPNYIWQLERNKYYTIEEVPDEWQTGSAIAKITDIEFAE